MSKMKHPSTMSYYSTLFQKYQVDDSLLDSRTKKRAIGSVLERVDKKKVNGNDSLDKIRLKKLRRAFKQTQWFKQVAVGLTFGAAVTLFQAPPVEARLTPANTTITKSDFVRVAVDTDSSVPPGYETQTHPKDTALDNTTRETTSLHFIANKPVFNEYLPLKKNSVLLDDDSDVAYSPQDNANHLTVIDTGIEDWQTLAQGINKGSVLMLNKEDRNPLDAIIAELKKIGEVASLNIISHGASGELNFTEQRISQESLQANKAQWQELGNYLDKEGDINLFGCNVAQGEKGQDFIKVLAELTSADVAASLNPTGNSEQGGDWELERVTGEVEAFALMSDNLANNWNHILAEYSLRVASSTGYDTLSIGDYTVTAYFFQSAGTGGTQIRKRDAEDKFTVIQRTDGKAFNFDGIYVFPDYPYDGTVTVAGKTTSAGAYDVFESHLFPEGSYGESAHSVLGDTAGFDAVFAVKAYHSTPGTGPGQYAYFGPKFYASGPVATIDSSGTLTAAGVVSEPIDIPTTATSSSPVTIFDFTISDGGGGDGETLDVSQIDLNLSGSASGNFSKLRFGLSGCSAASDIAPSGSTVSFTSTTISVAEGGSTTCTVSAYWADNSGITDNQTLNISIDGDTDLTVDGAKTQMSGGNVAVTTGNMITEVTATKLAFTTQPAGSVSGASLSTQPVVTALDAAGNTDIDFTETVTLTEASAGTFSGDVDIAAVNGVSTFTDVAYTATADQQSFTLTANDEDGIGTDLPNVDASSVTSDVVATKLVIDAQPVPLSVNTGVSTAFTTVPVVSAQDTNNNVDTGYSTGITLAEVNGAGSATLSGTGDTDGNPATVTITPSSGVSTFTGLNLTYTVSGGSSETFNLRASSGGLITTDSSQLIGVADVVSPTLGEVTAVTTPTNDTTPDMTFSSSEGGTLAVGGSCGSDDEGAVSSGNTTITLTQIDNSSALTDGSYSDCTLTVMDAAGNTSSALTLTTFTIDLTPPSGHSVSFNDSGYNASEYGSASFTFAGGEVGASYSYTISSSGGGTNVTGSGTLGSATDQITGLNLSGLGDGALTLSVVVTDVTGNGATAVTNIAALDATAPSGHSVSFDDSGINNSEASSQSFTFASGEVGASYSYTISSSGGGTNVTGSGTLSTATDQMSGLDLSGLGDGTLTLSVVVTDIAGNGATAVTDTATLDATAPSGHSVSFNDSDINNSEASSQSFTFAGGEVGASYSYTIGSSGGGTNVTGSGTLGSATDQISGLDLSGLGDGTLTLTVTVTDVAGNNAIAVTDTATLDATVPAGHSVSFNDSGINNSEASSQSFTFTGGEVGASYSYTISSSGGGTNVTGSGVLGSATDTITGLNLSGLGDGTLTLSVVVTDVAGNSATAVTDSALFDATAPSGHSVSFDDSTINNSEASSQSFTFAGGEVGADYSYTIFSSGGGTNVTGSGTLASTTDTITGLNLSGLGDGTLTLSAVVEDVAGNSATAVTDSALLDATAPSGHSVSFDDSTINNSERSSQSFTFTGGEVGADYSYTISSSGGGTNVTGSGTLTSATDTITGLNLSGLGDGTLTLSVVVTDVGGSAAGTVTYTAALDTLSPAAPSTPDLATISDNGVSTNDNRTSDTTPTFTGIAEVGSTVILTSSIDGQVGSSSTDGSGNWSITSSLSYTTYSMTATAMDGAGNQSSDSGALSLLINHDPAFAGTPTITGTPEVGETMGIAVLGTSDADTGDVVTLSYQWQRDSSNIPGAILSTYMLTATESNTTITCEISARDLNGGEKTFTTDGVKVGGDFPWLIFMPALSSPNKGQ